MSNEPFDFDRAYDRFGDGIYRFCLRMTGSRQDAEDLVQETFIAAVASWPKFDHRSSDSTWLFRIARNRVGKLLRRRTLTRLFRPQPRHAENPNEQIALEQALHTLPRPLREAFLLVKVEGLTCPEASLILDVPAGTLRFRVHQAIRRLREELSEYEPVAMEVPNAV